MAIFENCSALRFPRFALPRSIVHALRAFRFSGSLLFSLLVTFGLLAVFGLPGLLAALRLPAVLRLLTVQIAPYKVGHIGVDRLAKQCGARLYFIAHGQGHGQSRLIHFFPVSLFCVFLGACSFSLWHFITSNN